MNADQYVSVVIALSCVLAVGVSATTLETSLSTNPDDVINVEWSELPIEGEVAGTIEREMKSRQGGQQEVQSGSADDASDSAAASAAARDRQQSRQQAESQSGSQLREPSRWATLLAMLRSALPWLLALGFLAVCGTLGYRYRSRLRRLLAGIRHRRRVGRRDGEGRADPGPTEPATEIDRRWQALVRSLDVEDPRTTTVSEAVRRAIDRGLDPEAVRELADVFAAVRYGERPLTGERRRRARESYRALGLPAPTYADGGGLAAGDGAETAGNEAETAGNEAETTEDGAESTTRGETE